MPGKYSVSLDKVADAGALQTVFTPRPLSEIPVYSTDAFRPGLILTGFSEYFDPERIQFLGAAEVEYLACLTDEEREKSTERFLSQKPVAVVITRENKYTPEFIECAKKYEVPLFETPDGTSEVMSVLITFLNAELAPRITRHGVFVEVYGEGVLILGDSGVGKSETALELIKRGHRLIADDAVEIRNVAHKTLIGSAPENIRHFIELRGVGVINARRLFGVGSVKVSEKIDMVVQLEQWDPEKSYERLGLDNETVEILGVDVPFSAVPITPGRNISIIIEAAAMNNRQKKMGYNAARQLLHNLGMTDDVNPDPDELEIWHNF